MRFTLAQLRKLSMPYSWEEELDLSSELNGFENILSSTPCKIRCTIKERGIDTYNISFQITMEFVLEDSISLKEIPYSISTSFEELYTTDSKIEDAYIIQGQTLDTKEAIMAAILIEKPVSLTMEETVFEEESEEEEYINPAFASLKDIL